MESQDIQSEQNNSENKSKKGCFKIIGIIFLQIVIAVIVFVGTWHYAVVYTIKSIQGVLDFTRKTVKEYISASAFFSGRQKICSVPMSGCKNSAEQALIPQEIL